MAPITPYKNCCCFRSFLSFYPPSLACIRFSNTFFMRGTVSATRVSANEAALQLLQRSTSYEERTFPSATTSVLLTRQKHSEFHSRRRQKLRSQMTLELFFTQVMEAARPLYPPQRKSAFLLSAWSELQQGNTVRCERSQSFDLLSPNAQRPVAPSMLVACKLGPGVNDAIDSLWIENREKKDSIMGS